MARKISRVNGASWGTGKGLWGTTDGVTWLPAKKAWANSGGAWTQVWPPDMAFTSFAVTATTAEPGYGSSLISWAIDTSVPGTVSIQRKTPAGVWSDILTGQAVSGSYTQDPLIPTQGAAGTWQFRAVFIPTHDPSWLTYSALDSVTVTVPAASLTVTATTGEVYYTSSNMTWSVTGTTPGAVKLQRKLGVAGAWTDFATGLAKSGSSSYQLAPAGSANNGTWYYRAVFEPTHDASWDILSSEDSALVSYRYKGSVVSPSFHTNGTYNDDAGDNFWNLPWGYGGSPQYSGNYAGVGFSFWFTTAPVSVSVTVTESDGYYAWFDEPEGATNWAYSKASDLGGFTFTVSPTPIARPFGGSYLRTSGLATWDAYLDSSWNISNLASRSPYVPTSGAGFRLLAGTFTSTFEDGEVIVTNCASTPIC